MAIPNTYNPNPLTVDSLLKQRQTQGDLMREQGLLPAPQKAENPKVLGVEITPDSADKSFGRKVGEDAAMLAYGIPIGLAKILTGLVTSPIETVKEVGGALGQSAKDVVDPEYYKAHPLLGVVNLAGFAQPIAGIAKSMALKTATKVALDTALREATTLGVEQTVARAAFKEGVFKNAVTEAAKTGKTEIVAETIRNLLTKSAVADAVALRIGATVADNLYSTFSRQTTKMKVLESITHPIGSSYKLLSEIADPVRSSLFGEPTKTAVAALYGADTVKKNPEGFLQIERWAEAQVKERGLDNTVLNRQRVMQDWVEQNSQWASLTPEQRVAHFKNYAEQDLIRLQLHNSTGIDMVTVKALPQNYVDAMVSTIKDAPATVDTKGLLTLLEDTFGNDFKIHSAEIMQALARGGDSREALIAVVSKLGSARSTISFAKFSPEVQELAKQLEKTGYRIGHAPKGKTVSFASDIFQGAVPKVPEKEVVVDIAYQSTVKNGGVTISLEGKIPTKGFAYSPFKDTEFIVSKEKFDQTTVLDYVNKYAEKLAQAGNHLGIWEDGGKIYLDISKVAEPSISALGDAIRAEQLAGFDLETFAAVPLGAFDKGKKGVYTPLYEASNHPYLNKGKNIGTDSAGSVPGIPKVSEGAGGISTASVLAERTALGSWLDKLGFSPRGLVEGAAEFSYRENFTQRAIAAFVKENGILKAGNISIPTEKLFEWIDRNKLLLAQSRKKLTLPIHTVFDVKADDLIRAGFSKEIATKIEGISKQALNEIPTSITGMGDAVINYLRTRDKGFGAFMSNWYDKYLKAAYKGRYDWSPFFSAQQWLETKLNSALLLKDARLLPGSNKIQKLGSWTAEKLGKKLEGTKTYLSEIVAEPPLKQVAMVREEVLGTLQKTMLDYTSTPDIINIQNAAKGGYELLKDKAAFEQSIRSRNLWYAISGQSSVRMATTFNKALASKFGMSLEDALAFTVEEGGLKRYKNPQIVQLMREATQAAYHYEPGFLTSPLMKTMNIIWFPLRFQTKTAQLASRWLGSLSPANRMIVMNNWVHFANWAGTGEGIEWRRTNRNFLYNILAYTTAYEQVGQGIEAVTKGRLFGGNAGLIGGVPFGFVVNLARELAVLPEDPDQFDPKTGRPFQKQTPRNLISAATLSDSIEQLVISMSPSTPFYSLTGGVIGGVSPRKWIESLTRQVVGASREALEGRDPSRGRQMLERDFKRVPLDYTRLAQ